MTKANDNYPGFEEEFALAAMLQAARRFRLGWTRAACFRNKNGKKVITFDEEVAKCCAVGAWAIAEGAGALLRPNPVTNDNPDWDGAGADEENQLGHAFRSAMLDGGPWK